MQGRAYPVVSSSTFPLGRFSLSVFYNTAAGLPPLLKTATENEAEDLKIIVPTLSAVLFTPSNSNIHYLYIFPNKLSNVNY